jgi:hypothetical protein
MSRDDPRFGHERCQSRRTRSREIQCCNLVIASIDSSSHQRIRSSPGSAKRGEGLLQLPSASVKTFSQICRAYRAKVVWSQDHAIARHRPTLLITARGAAPPHRPCSLVSWAWAASTLDENLDVLPEMDAGDYTSGTTAARRRESA